MSVKHAFENLEEAAKDGIVDELLNQGPIIFGEVAKNQWGSYCIQHSMRFSCPFSRLGSDLAQTPVLEHGSNKHRALALDHLVSGLLEYATSEQGAKSVTKALKEGGKETLNRIIKRMCEPAKGYAFLRPRFCHLLIPAQGTSRDDSRPCIVCYWQSVDSRGSS